MMKAAKHADQATGSPLADRQTETWRTDVTK